MAEYVPDEILLSIFSFFELPPDVGITYPPSRTCTLLSTLSALVRCSKRFSRIALPLLYQTLYIRGPFKRYRLIRVLCENPDLGQHVRGLVVRDIPKSCATRGSKALLEQKLLNEAIRKSPRRFSLPPDLDDYFRYSVGSFSADAEVACLLAFLPNLQELLLDLPLHEGPYEVFEHAIQQPGPAPCRVQGTADRSSIVRLLPVGHFSELRKVLLSYPLRYASDENELLLSTVLKLPNLDTFSSARNEWNPATLDNVPGTLNLQHLDLDVSTILGPPLERLLSRCPKLRSLTTRVFRKNYGELVDRHKLEQIGNVLRRIGCPSLETLVVPATTWRRVDADDCRIGSLRKLQSLRELHVVLQDLVGMGVNNGESNDGSDESAVGAPENLGEWLPDSLESIHLKTPLRHDFASKYTHNQIVRLISNSTRTSLNEIYVSPFSHSPDYVRYSRNVEQSGWTVTYPGTFFKLRELIDDWPEFLTDSSLSYWNQ